MNGYVSSQIILASNLLIPPQRYDGLRTITKDLLFTHFSYVSVLVGYYLASILAHGWTLGLTWFKTYRLKREAEEANISAPIASMLLRDGAYSSVYHVQYDDLIYVLVSSRQRPVLVSLSRS